MRGGTGFRRKRVLYRGNRIFNGICHRRNGAFNRICYVGCNVLYRIYRLAHTIFNAAPNRVSAGVSKVHRIVFGVGVSVLA